MSTFDLGDEDAAVILRKSGSVEVHIPKKVPADGIMPVHVVLASAVAGRLVKDEEWVHNLYHWMEVQLSNIPEIDKH